MDDLISTLKNLSFPGVLGIHLGYKKIRIINSSNFISSIQRILPELKGSEKIEVLSGDIKDKKLRSILCHIHKCRLEQLGYKVVKCSINKWWLDKRIENIDGLKWVVRAKNRYSLRKKSHSILIGIFDKEEMQYFLKKYYPYDTINGVIISSNDATRKYYKEHYEVCS